MNSATIRVLGTTDEYLVCERCGRSDLKSTVVLDIDGDIAHYGSECAATVVGRQATDVDREARDADRAARVAAEAVRTAEHAARFATWEAFLVGATGEADVAVAIQKLGGFAEARAAFRAQEV